jgi:hypothetical protein
MLLQKPFAGLFPLVITLLGSSAESSQTAFICGTAGVIVIDSPVSGSNPITAGTAGVGSIYLAYKN